MTDKQDPDELSKRYAPTSSRPSDAPSPPPGIQAGQAVSGRYETFSPGLQNIAPPTPTSPDTQLSRDEVKAEETENRRARLSSNLLEQKHSLIRIVGWMITSVIVVLYGIFAFMIGHLFYTEKAFGDLRITTLVLLGMSGSIPTILSISLLVGLFAKEKEHDKDPKATLDIGTIAKACLDIAKVMKAPHN